MSERCRLCGGPVPRDPMKCPTSPSACPLTRTTSSAAIRPASIRDDVIREVVEALRSEAARHGDTYIRAESYRRAADFIEREFKV